MYEEDDDDYYNIEINIRGIRMIHKALVLAVKELVWRRSRRTRGFNCHER